MDTEPKKQAVTTIEGIGIHLGYINDHLISLDKKMDSLNSNTVTRGEWLKHLENDEDHEARLRALENITESVPIIQKLIYGAVGFILISVLGAVIYLVIKK